MAAATMGVRPPEPPRSRDVTLLAPGFEARLQRVLHTANDGLITLRLNIKYAFRIFEGYRSNDRQQWLYGSGKSYPGPWLTNASTNLYSWHGYGLAADVVPFDMIANDWTWDVPPSLWQTLYEAARVHGCTTGLHWHSADDDHVQPANLKVTPSDRARWLLANGGKEAVWKETGWA